ncbi:MAG: DUF438 domain-containing protein [Prevotella sp.]|uniref:DUF438 domain-containing protein n=1 Tax=Prevotella sp. TaxID=59823 RepID=UPI002A2A5647|nr:DUF438 domain-containing protein [Prevotella sp.]MDD7319205.1 DUF438 domain-containing protein [Prevotellaceae bacterium]MDY4020073.1 DUF438 domain-containing protein [Prevotella sp.]
MAKQIDFTKTVYELANEHPELIEVMTDVGFTEITKKVMLNSVGKLMTVPRGAKMKKIPMERIVSAFEKKGFEIVDIEGERADNQKVALEQKPQFTYVASATVNDRTEQIKGYLRRLSAGENLESVRADFVRHFSDVSSEEIMLAEQGLLKEGMPLKEVKKMCDVHSALFHKESAQEEKRNVAMAKDYADVALSLAAIDGHPLQTFYAENEALRTLLDMDCPQDEKVRRVRDIRIHYAKKGDLLFPLLRVKYDITGPSQVMWTVDDEIRDELAKLSQATEHDEAWTTRAEAVLKRADEMIFKENNILFPLCATNFTSDEWHGIYRDSKQYETCLGVEPKTWAEAERTEQRELLHEGEIVLAGGHLTAEQLTAMLNTLPMEITFVDADNINRFFNDNGPKVFKRPLMAIDREVFSCHPPKIEPMVRTIIEDFRAGRRDSVPIWMEKYGHPMLVTYMAVRDKQHQYLGTMELVQDMTFAKEHFK